MDDSEKDHLHDVHVSAIGQVVGKSGFVHSRYGSSLAIKEELYDDADYAKGDGEAPSQRDLQNNSSRPSFLSFKNISTSSRKQLLPAPTASNQHQNEDLMPILKPLNRNSR